MFKPVPPKADFAALEAEILAAWKAEKVFETVQNRASEKEWVFYEGPPTANGMPALHHVLARSFKDLFPRYKTMTGHHVTRKGGWDTHGLPVEIAVEKKLGWLGRNHGATRAEMEEFNRLCRESVWETIQDWNTLTERMGYWVDLEDPYVTYHNDYIESVWNTLQALHKRGHVVQDYKVVPLSPRISSTLSRAELGEVDSYRMVDDPSLYVRFPILWDKLPERAHAALSALSGEARQNLGLLLWTTTPWTLPSNAMAAVHPELSYVVLAHEAGPLVLAEAALERVLALHKQTPEDAQILAKFSGSDLSGVAYQSPFPEAAAEMLAGERPEKLHTVTLAEFVTTEDGSGIVHMAPAYGADDLEICRGAGVPLMFGVDDHGILQVTDERGKFFKDADKGLVRILKERGLVHWIGTIKHKYPFHDRTGDPILYFAKKSWYIRTSQKRDEMLAANAQINWVPGRIQNGRFGKWLEGNVDWAISRERYWGTPLPFWMSEDGDLHVIGSKAELKRLTGQDLVDLDLHRPYIDDVTFEKNGKTYRRVPEVLDVWFDSGAMPYAQWGLLRNENGELERGGETFKSHFPADFICEAIDQTRGWFYSLHAISTLLNGTPAYKNVVCLGHIVDEKGHKMSKSKGNVIPPLPLFDKYGADTVRWFMFTAAEPGEQQRVSERLVAEAGGGFVVGLWNVYSFFVLYANLDQPDLQAAPAEADRPEMDRWLLSRLEETRSLVTDRLEAYDARGAALALERFANELSNWYVRRSRSRFWTQGGQTDLAAFATLHEVLRTVTLLAAPFVPFVSDEMYRNLTGSSESVHLQRWPEARPERLNPDLAATMGAVIRVVELGRAVRASTGIKTRQPLAKVQLRVPETDLEGKLSGFFDQIKEELNVKTVEFLPLDAQIIEYALRPNLPVVGKRLGKDLPAFRAALADADAARVVRELADKGESTIGEYRISAEEVLVDARAPEGLAAAERDGFLLAFDTELTDDLRQEGAARDFIRAVQEGRKNAGFDVSDRIVLGVTPVSDEAKAMLKHWAEDIKTAVLAREFQLEVASEDGFAFDSEAGRVNLRRI